MTQSNTRIACPKCRSNNFPGTPACWNCGASLPPPESVLPAAPGAPAGASPAAPRPMPVAPPYSSARSSVQPWMIVVPLALVLLIVAGFALVRTRMTTRSGPADDLKAQIEALKKQIGPGAAAGTASADTTEDPDIAAAKREMDRLRKQHGIEPPADPAGNVHLQGGGTVSQETYQKALDAISRSRLGK